MNITPDEHSQLVSCTINGDFSPLKKETLAEVLHHIEKEFQSKCGGKPLPGKAAAIAGYRQFKHMDSDNLVFLPKALVGDADIASVGTDVDDIWIVVATDGTSKGNIVDVEA